MLVVEGGGGLGAQCGWVAGVGFRMLSEVGLQVLSTSFASVGRTVGVRDGRHSGLALGTQEDKEHVSSVEPDAWLQSESGHLAV